MQRGELWRLFFEFFWGLLRERVFLGWFGRVLLGVLAGFLIFTSIWLQSTLSSN